MKKTRRIGIQTLGIVRQLTGEGAPEGGATDCLNLRLKDGALRPVGHPAGLQDIQGNGGAREVLFHQQLPDGEYLYRIDSTIYHSKQTGDTVVLTFTGESFVMWKAFGTSLIVVTSKYTRVSVIKDGVWINIPIDSGNAPSISHNMLEGVTFQNQESWFTDNCNTIIVEKDDTEQLVMKFWYDTITNMKTKGMVHGCYLAIACIKLADSTTILCSIPTYVQHGITTIDDDGGSTGQSWNDFTPLSAKTWVSNPFSSKGNDYACYIHGGPYFAKPKLTINLTSDVVSMVNALRMLNMVSGIAIYATRKKDLYDYEKTFCQYKNIESRGYIYKSPSVGDSGEHTYYWNPTLNEIKPEDPFFLLKEYPITADIGSTVVVDLKPDDFDSLETRETLSANGSRHSLRASTWLMEYNSRLHGCGITSTLTKGDVIPVTVNSCQFIPSNLYGYTPHNTSLFSAYLETTIPVDGNNYIVKKSVPIDSVLFRKGDGSTQDTGYAVILPPLVAYPDARAILIRLILVNGSGAHYEAMNIPLKACLEGNFAYAKGTSTEVNVTQPPFIKFIAPKLTSRWDDRLQTEVSEWVFDSSQLAPILFPPSESREFVQTNRMQVWNYGSPLSYELKNSYRFGAGNERLLRCETTVDQLSEGRFGQFPLYCFTDRGVYALEQGQGGVLYATSHPISSDGILSPIGATPLSGAVAFITAKGVMVISGRQVTELSAPIRGAAEYYDAESGLPAIFHSLDVPIAQGGPQEPSLQKYLSMAEMHHLYRENELLVYNPMYQYAWVYGMNSRMWYRRQLPLGYIQRYGSILFNYSIASNGVGGATVLHRYDLENEYSFGRWPLVWISRPLELGSNGYKKIEAAVVRLDVTVGGVSIPLGGNTSLQGLGNGVIRAYILASIDGITYKIVQGVSIPTKGQPITSIKLGRSGLSARYFVLAVAAEPTMCTAIERIDFELEDRFSAKLR